jgi:hypothetical protein
MEGVPVICSDCCGARDLPSGALARRAFQSRVGSESPRNAPPLDSREADWPSAEPDSELVECY